MCSLGSSVLTKGWGHPLFTIKCRWFWPGQRPGMSGGKSGFSFSSYISRSPLESRHTGTTKAGRQQQDMWLDNWTDQLFPCTTLPLLSYLL